jgi:hypothetical protein
MAIILRNNFSTLDNLNLSDTLGIQFTGRTSDPTDADLAAGRIYFNSSSNAIKVYNGSSWVAISAAGGSGATLDSAYDGGPAISVDGAAIRLNGSHATNNQLELRHVGAGTGNMIDIQNDSTGTDGFDIEGTDNTWKVSSAGALQVISIKDSATNATLQVNGDGSGGVDIGSTSTGAITLGAAVNVASAKLFTIIGTAGSTYFDLTAGDATISDGALSITDNDNAAALVVVNNTITTSTAGLIDIDSTSITSGYGLSMVMDGVTSGTMIYLESSAASFTGNFIRAHDGSANVFRVGLNGATIIKGTAAGTAALTLDAGDLTVTDGVVALTNTGTIDVFSVTANSLLANNLAIFKGSGAFTGTASNSFVAITPTGGTTGTALYVAMAAATTLSTAVDVTTSTTTGTALRLTASGVLTGAGSVLELIADSATTPGAVAGEGIVKLSADAVTTGTLLDVTSTSIVLTTGRIVDLSHISGNITGTLNKTVDLFNMSAERTVTTGTVADDYDMVNHIRTSIINGGGTFSATGSVMYVENAVTNTSGTVTDTVNGIQVVMDSLGTGHALSLTHNATGGRAIDIVSAATTATVLLVTAADLTTTGVGLSITNNTATGLTSGSLIRVNTATAGALATNGVVSIRGTGAHTSTANIGLLDVQSSGLVGAGTLVDFKVTNTSQTAATALNVEQTTTTTGYTGDFVKITGTSTTGASNLLLLTGANTSAGVMLRLTNDALTTGEGMVFAHATSVIADGGSMVRLSSSSVDTGGATNGTILDIASTGSTAGVAVLLTDSAMTTGAALKVVCTGVYSGTGAINLATAATTGVGMLVTNSSLTTGTGVSLVNGSSNTGAWKGLSVSITNTAATAAAPIRTSNVAVNNSKFTRVLEATDGTKTVTIWLSQDATTPNGTLSGTAGDICLNGPSNRTFYCTGTTNWTASNA